MKTRKMLAWLISALILLGIVVALGWFGGWSRFMQPSDEPEVAVAVSASVIDPDNEGRLVSVQGKLEYKDAPADPDLGFVVDGAVALMRRVEMYQWQETCIDGSCTQAPAWAERVIDSRGFHEQIGHDNPGQLPFESVRLDATGVHVGAFRPDSELVDAQVAAVARPVRLGEMPANLAASFSEYEGQILAGTDPMQPVVGGLRISYRIIPSTTVILIGVQHGDRLVAPASKPF